MNSFRKLSRSLSDITEEDADHIESLSESWKYSDLITPHLCCSCQSVVDCNLQQQQQRQQQQRIVYLKQFRNFDTTYLMYNLYDENRSKASKINKISCDLECTISMHRNRNDINDSCIVDGDDENFDKIQLLPQTTIMISISPQRDDCLTFAPSPLEEHQEDSGIENNCRSSSIDDHSPATSLDFLPPIGLNQLDTRNSFNTSLSPSPSNQHYYCYQHLELSLPEKSFFDHPTITTSENGYSVPSTSKLLRTDTITKADLPEQNQSRSVTPQADNSQQYFGENSDSDSDFPAPPDYLLPETAVQSKIRTINLYDQEKQLINCTNMKSNSTNNSISTTKREPLSTLTGKRNTSIAAREAIKFPITRQTNPSCQKGILEISDGNIQSETNTINKSKQASLSSFLPYTSTTAKLSSDQARGHHGGATDTIYPRTSPKISRTNRLANEVHELTVPKSHLKTVDIQFEDKPGAAYQPSNIERNNTKMSQQVGGIGEMINVKINLENDDRIDERKHFGFTVTGGKDKNAPVKIDAVIVGTPADQAGLQVGDLLLSINGESVMDRYYQCVVRMLHEAERLGNIELRIRRSDNAVIGPRISAENQSPIIDQRSTISFDQKRALFDDKYITKNSNYKGIRKQKHSSPPTRKWPMGNLNKHPENATPVAITAANAHNVKDVIVTRSNSALSSISALDDDDPRVTYISGGKCSMRHSRERFSSRTSLASSTSCSITGGGTDPDYRVTSLHDKPKPGKLADFIPEVERKSDVGYEQDDGASAYSSSFSRQESDVDGFTNLFTSEDDGEAPLVLRNYDITPISYWMKKDEARTMSLPRNIGGEYRRNGYVVPCNLPITTKSITQRDIISSEENVANNGSQPKNSSMDCREWRELIEQQRLPSPGDPESRNRIDADLKLEVRPNKDTGTHQNTRCGNGKLSRQISQSEATRMKKSNSSIENFSSADELLISRKLLENNRSTASNSNRAHASNEQNNRKVSNKLSTATDEPLLSVSGKHRCSHCAMELGRGAAMIIESLNLFYHLSCFRCYVCKMTLGNGSRGTDVRVRDSKLHCQSCYSNEESGLKFSKV
uniref:PDZ domain-containing protein n=1 Tax=Setaria digitata TaxID=48799 RepID=A0A915PQL5_9BILA